METLYVTAAKYIFVLLMAVYTWECFSALKTRKERKTARIFHRQNAIIFIVYVLGISVVYLKNPSNFTVILAGAQLCYLVIVLGIFPIIYSNISRAVLSNMCMLLSIGFIMLARLNFETSVRQFIIVAVVTMASLIVPFLMSKFQLWKYLTWVYCFVGIAALIAVLFLGDEDYGAKLAIEIGNFKFQPSEFVKIIFVFFLAGYLAEHNKFKDVCISAVLAAIYVLILVASTDLGSALIFFMIYLFMLFVSTRNIIYLFLGAGGLSGASVIAYHLFSHVQERFIAWRDPWSAIDNAGYQVAQSLFAIGSGGFMGTGLYEGSPKYIPVVTEDFIFSAIAEEFGGLFAMLLILVCFSCFIAFLKIAMEQANMFNKLVCVGLGVGYAVQVFLTIGGALKMIPSTGVTLPLVSSGGSSILSTLFVFAIMQGLAIVGTKVKRNVTRRIPTEGLVNEQRQTERIRQLERTGEIGKVGKKKKKKIK